MTLVWYVELVVLGTRLVLSRGAEGSHCQLSKTIVQRALHDIESLLLFVK